MPQLMVLNPFLLYQSSLQTLSFLQFLDFSLKFHKTHKFFQILGGKKSDLHRDFFGKVTKYIIKKVNPLEVHVGLL